MRRTKGKMWAFVIVGMLALVLGCCTAAGRGDDMMEPVTLEPPETVFTPVEVWVLYPVPLEDDLQRYISGLCRAYGVDMPLVMAVIDRESSFQADLIGDDGNSFGLMQIYANQHTDRCIRLNAPNLLDPYQNVRVGIDYLAELLDSGKGVEWALMAYNGGPVYAGELWAKGDVSAYAQGVVREAECLMESAQVIVE